MSIFQVIEHTRLTAITRTKSEQRKQDAYARPFQNMC